MAAHTKRSPSQAGRFHGCPGSDALIAALPAEQRMGPGPAAKLGTSAHALLERCLREDAQPVDFMGHIIELVSEDEDAKFLKPGSRMPGERSKRVCFEVDARMVEGVEVATDYVRGRLEELGITFAQVQLETRTNPLPDRDDTSGTADITIDAFPEVLEVVDYKNGYMVVGHEDNKQAKSYLLGKAIEAGFLHDSFVVTIVQPHADHADGRIRSTEYTREDLLEFQREHRAAVELSVQVQDEYESYPDAETRHAWERTYLHTGEQCTFCDAAAICPARRLQSQELASLDFEDAPLDEQAGRDAAATLAHDDIERVAEVLKWSPHVTAFMNACWLYAQRAMEAGVKVPDFKLVEGRSVRRWTDEMTPERIVQRMAKLGMVKQKDAARLWAPRDLITGVQAEKLVPKDKRERFNELFLEKPAGRVTIAPESDEREEVLPDPGADFAGEDD